MSGPNPQPPTATLGAPLDTPSPATQVFGALEVAPYQVVYRQGATRGTGATDVRGPICGTWAQVLAMLQSMWLVPANQGTGQTLRLVCDGNDPLNPNGASSGIVSVPAGGPYALPPNVALDGGASAQMVIEAGATFADDFFWSEVNVPLVCATGALAATPFTIVTAEIFCRLGPGVTIGGGDNTILLNVTNSQNAVFYSTGQSSGYDQGAFESQDGTGRVVITCITSGSVALGAFTQTAFPIPVGQAEIQLDASSTNEEVSYAAAVLLLDAASAVTFTDPTGNVVATDVADAILEEVAPFITFLPNGSPATPQVGRVAFTWGGILFPATDAACPQTIFVNLQGSSSYTIPTASPQELFYPSFVGVNDGTDGFPTIDLGADGFTWYAQLELHNLNLTTASGLGGTASNSGPTFLVVIVDGISTLVGSSGGPVLDFGGAALAFVLMSGQAVAGDGLYPVFANVTDLTINLEGNTQLLAGCIDGSVGGVAINAVSGSPYIAGSLLGNISTITSGTHVYSNADPPTLVPGIIQPGATFTNSATNVTYIYSTVWTPIGITTSFVFQPGGTAGGNVYTDPALLAAAVKATSGYRTILFDFSISGPYSMTGVAFDCGPDVEWLGTYWSEPSIVPLTFAGGSTIPAASFPQRISGLQVIVSQVTDLVTDTAFDFEIYNTEIQSDGTGGLLSTHQTNIFEYGGSEIGNGTNPVLNGTSHVLLFDSSTVLANAFDSPTTATIDVLSSGASFDPTYPGAGVTVYYSASATFEGYVPGAPGNWAGSPKTVAEAIDRIAAVVSVGGTSPIP